jgi:leucyl-tRNA---protein transferase
MASDKLISSQPITGDSSCRVPSIIAVDSSLRNEHECSYLPGKTANLPLVLSRKRLSMEAVDAALAAGMRRAGIFLYYTACADCHACEPSRVDVHRFRWTDSWKRISHRGDRLLTWEIAPTKLDDEHVQLFNRHRSERGLGEQDSAYRNEDYESFLVDSCCEQTHELRFRMDGQLVAVSVVDMGARSVSAVYTYFDPDHSKLSLGTYSILKQIEFCLATARQYVYLGMYVSANQHLNYKARFKPQQRWIRGQWIDFDRETQ